TNASVASALLRTSRVARKTCVMTVECILEVSMKKRIVAVAISGIIIVIPVVLFVRVKIAERAWAQSLGDLDSLTDLFHGEKNETTEMFSDWSSDLGLTSVVGGKASALDPGVADAIAAIAKYVSAVQTSDAAAPAAPPPVVW